MADQPTFGQKHFGLTYTTFVFVLLCIATCEAFVFVWAWRLCARLVRYRPSSQLRALALVWMGLWAWGFGFAVEADIAISMLGNLLVTAAWILLLVISYKSKSLLSEMLAQEGLPLNLNSLGSNILAFFFPLIYQYYVVVNAEAICARQQGRSAPATAPQTPPSQPASQPGSGPAPSPQETASQAAASSAAQGGTRSHPGISLDKK